MSGLPDAERDACDVLQALSSLSALLSRPAGTGADRTDDDTRRMLLQLTQDGGAAAQRVVAYLRALRGAGDGEVAAVPPRLGLWRDWVPPRGMLFGDHATPRRVGGLPQPRRCDPGE